MGLFGGGTYGKKKPPTAPAVPGKPVGKVADRYTRDLDEAAQARFGAPPPPAPPSPGPAQNLAAARAGMDKTTGGGTAGRRDSPYLPPGTVTGGRVAQGNYDANKQAAIEKAKAASKQKAADALANGQVYDPAIGGVRDLDEATKVRMAKEEELRIEKQKAQQTASARAGLYGFGGSGGTDALIGDVGRQYDRSNTLTMADFDRKQADAKWKETQRDLALDELELEYNRDIDGDGLVAGGEPWVPPAEGGADEANEQFGKPGAGLPPEEVDALPTLPAGTSAYDLNQDYEDLGYAANSAGDVTYVMRRKSDGKIFRGPFASEGGGSQQGGG